MTPPGHSDIQKGALGLVRRPGVLVLGLGLSVLGLVLLTRATRAVSPVIHGDEAGYLGNARYIVSGYGRTADGHYAGYSVLLTPAAFLTDDPLRLYRFVLGTNVILLIVSAVLAFMLARQLFPGRSTWPALAAAASVALYPLVVTLSATAMSENALVPAVLGCTVALAHAARVQRTRFYVVAALLAAFVYWITPRGIIVVGAFAGTLAIESCRRRIPARMLMSALSALAVGLVAGHLFNDVVRGPAGIAGVDGRDAGLVEPFYPHNWPDWAAGITGRVAYLSVASVGLFLLGIFVAARFATAQGADPLTSVRRTASAFAVLAFAGTIVADAAAHATKGVLPRLDFLYYGRYSEAVGLPVLALGVSWLFSDRRRRDVAIVAFAVPALSGAALLSTFLLERERPPESSTHPLNVLSLVPIADFFDTTTVATAIVVGSLVTPFVLFARLGGRAFGALCLSGTLGVGGFVARDLYVERNAAFRATQRALVPVIHLLESNGVPTDCIQVDAGTDYSSWHDRNYHVFLPRSSFVSTEVGDTEDCGPLLIADTFVTNSRERGLAFVAGENDVSLGLWVDTERLAPGVRDRLFGAGLAFADSPCVVLPDAAYAARIDAKVTRRSEHALDVAIDVAHIGGGAPWLGSNTLVTPGGCGRVSAFVDLLDDDGDVIREERVVLPDTLMPGEADRLTVTLEVTGDDSVPQVSALRIGLIQDGVSYFHDRGGDDLIVRRDGVW